MDSPVIIFIISLVIMIAAADFLVKGASAAALKIHLSPMVVGLTIVAFGTSAPELFISVNSALTGSPDIALGNVVGSNICNLGLVLGAAALINPIVIKSSSLKVDWPMALGSVILLYVFILDGSINALESLIFLAILTTYIYLTIKKSRKDTLAQKAIKEEVGLPEKGGSRLVVDILLIVVGCSGLYFGSDWFVGSAKELARNFGMSERVIGLTMVAVGTSLPELVTSIMAAIKKHTDLALGNLIGSNIFNVLAILGITGVIHHIDVSRELHVDIYWTLGITLILLPIMLTHKAINRFEGALLLGIYGYYVFSVF